MKMKRKFWLLPIGIISLTTFLSFTVNAQSKKTKKMKDINQLGINHIAINAVDADATVNFYTKVFGAKHIQEWNKAVGKNNKGQFELPVNVKKIALNESTFIFVFVGAGTLLPAEKNVGNVHHFTIRVNNVDAVYKQALESGAKVSGFGNLYDGSPADFQTQQNGKAVFDCRIAFIEGLNGEIIEIYQNL